MKKIILCLLISLGLLGCSSDNQTSKEKQKNDKQNTIENVETNSYSDNKEYKHLKESENEKRNVLQSILDQANATYSTNFQIENFESIDVFSTDSVTINFSATIKYETPYNYTAEYTVLYSGEPFNCIEIETTSLSPNYDYLLQEKYPQEVSDLLVLANATGLVSQDLSSGINSFFINSCNEKKTIAESFNNLIAMFSESDYTSDYSHKEYKLSISVKK